MRRLVVVLFVLMTGCAPQCAPPPAPYAPGSITRDVAYAIPLNHEGEYEVLHLDLHQPTNPNGAAVVLAHGGGFTSGNKSQMEGEARRLVAEGYVVANINYRLRENFVGFGNINAEAVATVFDAADDARSAIRWLRTDAARTGIDPSRISILGVSAGAVIGLTVGMNGQDASGNEPSGRVCSVVSRAGALIPELASADDAPTYFHHGSNDTRVPFAQARATKDALQTKGVDVVWDVVDNGGHVPPLSATSRDAIDDFLASTTSANSPSCPR
ncbi:MAG: alpha/beta hydrolase [Microthrixaceae bacterium]